MNRKFGLIILDGWGIGDGSSSDAIAHAKTPFMDGLMQRFPTTTLTTFGEDVGLPEGQMGNSEVGHLNIGAGRIVYQELTRINKDIREGNFDENPVLLNALKKVTESGVKLHFMGLVSNGGVHSSQEHLYALCELAKKRGVNMDQVYVHAFTDGRDCDPKSGLGFIQDLGKKLLVTGGTIATVIGRYYAMDRDNRWERVAKAYHLLVNGKGTPYSNAEIAIQAHYDRGITDEFIEPCLLTNKGVISEGDVVICFNFRTDRPREITTALTQKDFPELDMKKLKLHYCSMTNYDASFNDIQVIFEKDNLNLTLGEVLANHNKTQVRIAETEKYPHVTFFFSGGREIPFSNEERILVNSPKVATYDLQPEMSALEVKDKICAYMQEKKPDFICLNFANPDMVGHTGVYQAIVKAVETVDSCLKEVVETGQELGYEFLVIADHGNADYALNSDGSPNTAHSMNPVPAVLVTKDASISLNSGKLADVAPTILDRMGIQQPAEMNGKSLLK